MKNIYKLQNQFGLQNNPTVKFFLPIIRVCLNEQNEIGASKQDSNMESHSTQNQKHQRKCKRKQQQTITIISTTVVHKTRLPLSFTMPHILSQQHSL